MDSAERTNKILSRLTWLFTIAIAAMFALAASYFHEGASSAGDFAVWVGLAFVALSLLAWMEHALNHYDGFREALGRVFPKRWLGLEVDEQ